MRKQTKLVAVASAAALLAIGASMTSFAATGWVEEGGEWFYYEKDGSKAEDAWKKSGDKWFWLDSEENGAMAIDKLVEDGDNTYYVDTTGAMVSNTWVKVVNEDQDDDDDPAEYNYYYMQANGKAYKTGDTTTTKFKTIDGKRYAFNDEGKMLYGWVNGAAERLTGDDGWSIADPDVYYLGNWDDGAMKTGWQKIYVSDTKADEEKEHWFYFNSNGKRFFLDASKDDDKDKTLKTKKINGKTYGFDERGVMVYEWNMVVASNTNASPNNWSYYNTPEDGARVTKGWFKVIPPSDETTFTENVTSFDEGGADDESNNWYYADGSGNLYASAVKKIKGKYYAFNEKGKMLNGLVFMSVNDEDGTINKVYEDGVDADELDKIMDYDFKGSDDDNASLYYFGSDADSDGSMKTGNVVVSIDGDSHNFMFAKTGGVETRGKGVTGLEGEKYIYQYGKRIKASSDDKYVMVAAAGDIASPNSFAVKMKSSAARNEADRVGMNSDDETVRAIVLPYAKIGDTKIKVWLVNTSGAIVKNKSAAKDGDDWYFFVDKYEIKAYANNKNLKKTRIEDWKALTPSVADEDVNSIALDY